MIFISPNPMPHGRHGKIVPGSKEPRWQGNSAIPHHAPSPRKKENKK